MAAALLCNLKRLTSKKSEAMGDFSSWSHLVWLFALDADMKHYIVLVFALSGAIHASTEVTDPSEATHDQYLQASLI